MNCQATRVLLPELLDRRTPASAHPEARAHLAGCPDCQRELAALRQTAEALDTLPTPAPSPRLRTEFYRMLETEKAALVATPPAETSRPRRSRMFTLWAWALSPLAAAALVALGFFLGRNTPVSSGAPATEDTRREIAALREQMGQQREQLAQQNSQLEKMTTLVSYQILQQQQSPASERFNEVLAAAKKEQPSPKVLDNLVQALTLDPSANVRLRAVQALYPHAANEAVRAGVMAALPREQNPLVQLELIDFMAATQDRDAAPVLEQISADEAVNRTVRDAARVALAQF